MAASASLGAAATGASMASFQPDALPPPSASPPGPPGRPSLNLLYKPVGPPGGPLRLQVTAPWPAGPPPPPPTGPTAPANQPAGEGGTAVAGVAEDPYPAPPPVGPKGDPQPRVKVPTDVLNSGPIPVPRVEDLTLEEKIGQMTQVEKYCLRDGADVANFFLGSVLSGGGGAPDFGNAAEDWADMVDSFQAQALRTRLRIPMLYGVDAVHGHNNVLGATVFPHNIGLGAAGDPELVREIGAATAKEVAATGIRWAFSPTVAVLQDPRWGRTYECFGEDTALVQSMTTEIDGWQERVADPSDPASRLPGALFVAACAKHYVGDGGTAGGVDQGDCLAPEEELRRVHLAPYVDAVARGVATVMISYSSWRGVKMHAHRHLVTDVLKGELGFRGLVVSDWEAIQKMPGDWNQQVRDSINAGLDMIMVPNDYKGFVAALTAEVAAGRVPMSRIDDAVARILRTKEAVGLFDAPFADRELLPCVGCAAHRQLARRAALRSLVLLKNERRGAGGGRPVFPLPMEGKRVLVAGSHADNVGLQCGGWTIAWQGESGPITPGTTVLEGIREIVHANGGEVAFAEALTGAEEADLAIIVVGEQPYAEFLGQDESLQLSPVAQSAIAVLSPRMPCVAVLVAGRPLEVAHLLPLVDALVAAWLPGSEAGGAVAAALFSPDEDFTGRLPLTWFASSDQQPLGRGNPAPLFPCGFGLSKKGTPL